MKQPKGEAAPSQKPVRAYKRSVSEDTQIQVENLMKSVALYKGWAALRNQYIFHQSPHLIRTVSDSAAQRKPLQPVVFARVSAAGPGLPARLMDPGTPASDPQGDGPVPRNRCAEKGSLEQTRPVRFCCL